MKSALSILGLFVGVVGLSMVLFAPGGWLNNRERNTAKLDTPIGSIGVSAETSKSSEWPKVGYGLLAGGAVLLVAGAAAKSSAR